jgi:hypothetical protein
MQGKSIFISYAHADPENFIDEIHRHLRITFRGIKQFELWTDDRIRVTEAWDGEIKDALRRSRCAILLVSANFLDSEYVFEQELPIILSRSKDEQLGLIPVFVSKVPKRSLKVPFPYRGRTEEFDLASQQGPNGPDNPLDRMGEAERNALLASLADQVAEWLEEQEPSRPDEERPARVKSAPPPVSPADARPELCVQLD